MSSLNDDPMYANLMPTAMFVPGYFIMKQNCKILLHLYLNVQRILNYFFVNHFLGLEKQISLYFKNIYTSERLFKTKVLTVIIEYIWARNLKSVSILSRINNLYYQILLA